jgi:hypothetical protein
MVACATRIDPFEASRGRFRSRFRFAVLLAIAMFGGGRANRSMGDSLDSDRDALTQGWIPRCGGKKFYMPVSCRRERALTKICTSTRALFDARCGLMRARSSCKKAAWHKGFLHRRRMSFEISCGAQYIATLDKQHCSFVRDIDRVRRAR